MSITTAFNLGSSADVDDISYALFRQRWASADYPYIYEWSGYLRMGTIADALSAMPPWRVVRKLESDSDDAFIMIVTAQDASFEMIIECSSIIAGDYPDDDSFSEDTHTITIMIMYSTAGQGRQIVSQFIGDREMPRPVTQPDDQLVAMKFWRNSPMGPTYDVRRLRSPSWEDIQRNYTASVQNAAGQLMDLKPDDIHGKIILFHGEPGTGKTTMIRALARQWNSWCHTIVVSDPEKMLNDGEYLNQVVSGGHSGQWNMIVLEDSGELFVNDAGEDGQALSRLLNMSDGLLGQGMNVLWLLTTNKHHDSLRQSMTRPGRALANIEIGPMQHREAVSWMRGELPEGRTYTLAELYSLSSDTGSNVITNLK